MFSFKKLFNRTVSVNKYICLTTKMNAKYIRNTFSFTLRATVAFTFGLISTPDSTSIPQSSLGTLNSTQNSSLVVHSFRPFSSSKYVNFIVFACHLQFLIVEMLTSISLLAKAINQYHTTIISNSLLTLHLFLEQILNSNTS